MKFALIAIAAVANLVLAAAVVKELSAGFLKAKAAIAVIPGFFNLAYVENRGCAWGLFQGRVWPLAAFGALALAFLIWKRRSVFPAGAWGAVSEVLLYAGIVGNLIDRVYRGFVVDMFDFYWGVHHFPCFNVADVCISVAAAIMIALSVFEKDGGKKPS